MGVLTLLFIIVVIGLAVYAIRRWVPIDPAFQTIVLIVGVIVAIIVCLSAFGLLPVGDIQVPRVR